jgi:hypothetical protein
MRINLFFWAIDLGERKGKEEKDKLKGGFGTIEKS